MGDSNPVKGTNPNRGINSAQPHCRRVKPPLQRITFFFFNPNSIDVNYLKAEGDFKKKKY